MHIAEITRLMPFFPLYEALFGALARFNNFVDVNGNSYNSEIDYKASCPKPSQVKRALSIACYGMTKLSQQGIDKGCIEPDSGLNCIFRLDIKYLLLSSLVILF